MDPARASKNPRRGKLTKSRAVVESSPNESPSQSLSSSDEEPQNSSSRAKLVRQSRQVGSGGSSSRKSFSEQRSSTKSEERSESTVIEVLTTAPKPPVALPAAEVAPPNKGTVSGSSLARSIKKKFAFFRKSAEAVRSSEDVEAAPSSTLANVADAADRGDDTSETTSKRVVDVVVDVHAENETRKSKKTEKKRLGPTMTSWSDDYVQQSSTDNLEIDSEDQIEELGNGGNAKGRDLGSSKTNLFDNGSDELEISSLKDEEDEEEGGDNKTRSARSNEELTSDVAPTSGGSGSARRRKRWGRPDDITTQNLVEDLRERPKRKQWAKGAASAEIKNITGQKIVLPKRSATAEPGKLSEARSIKSSVPVAAPRSKSLHQRKTSGAYDNDGFSSDHEEVLRIETVDDSSPKIKLGSKSNDDEIEDSASTLSELGVVEGKLAKSRRQSIQDVELPSMKSFGSTENSDRSPSWMTNGFTKFTSGKTARMRRSSAKQKSSSEKKSTDDDDDDDDRDDNDEEEEDVDEMNEEEEDQATVLNVARKKSRSTSSSKVEIIPTNFFEKDSSDETTISSNEEMHTSRKGSRDSKSSRSRSKSKSTRRTSDGASERSSRSKHKPTTSSSTRNSMEEQQRATTSGEKSGSARSRSMEKQQLQKKRKKKKRHRSKEKPTKPADKSKLEDEDEETGEVKYVSMRIHRTDMLEADYITKQPMVLVHIVNAESGDYLKMDVDENSRDKDEEDKEKRPQLLEPLITGKFDFAKRRSMVAIWDEELIFQRDLRDLLVEGRRSVVVLFEIVDQLGLREVSRADTCFHKVAWAFLRPVGESGVRHVNKKLRLQLYRPRKTFRRPKRNKCEVYRWWKSGSRDKYPSSLYVTVSGVDPPKLEPVLYEQLLEQHDLLKIHSPVRESPQPAKSSTDGATGPRWTRLAAQSCRIPNEAHMESEVGESGCFYVAFSNDGKYLACVLADEYDYPILVYKVEEAKIHARFAGHKDFVYSLSWSHDDSYLLSVSSDRTARLWDVRERIIEPVQSLPHPAYVYCGKFSPESSSYVVTGCYDRAARVWSRAPKQPTGSSSNGSDAPRYELAQELEGGHESFVSAICCRARDEAWLTGDGAGVVVLWTARRSRRSPVRREWRIARRIGLREAAGVPINGIAMHPMGSRVLVHSRNGGLRLVDLASGTVVRKYEGLRNERIQITSCISPCGGLLLCGGENSTLSVWSVDSGELLATYDLGDQADLAVTCVDYHPYDHALAYCVYGAPLPARILKYDRDAGGRTVGLRLLANGHAPMQGNGVARQLSGPLEAEEARRNLRAKMQRFVDSGPGLKAKSVSRLNGIIEKIDRILMYASGQRTPELDVEAARATIFTVEEKYPVGSFRNGEAVELAEFPVKPQRRRNKQRARSRSARVDGAEQVVESEFSARRKRAFSDSAAVFSRRDSSESAPSIRSPVATTTDPIAEADDPPADEIAVANGGGATAGADLNVESVSSDDTYVVEKAKGKGSWSDDGAMDKSASSNATFTIENEVQPAAARLMMPVPRPRKRLPGRIEVM